MTGYPSFASKKVFLFYDGPFRTRGLFFRIFIKKILFFIIWRRVFYWELNHS